MVCAFFILLWFFPQYMTNLNRVPVVQERVFRYYYKITHHLVLEIMGRFDQNVKPFVVCLIRSEGLVPTFFEHLS